MRATAEVTAIVKRLSDGVVVSNLDAQIEPDPDENGTGSLTLSFINGTPEETYKVEVRARDLNAETTYNADQDLFVKPDLTKPKFLSYTPLNGTFVKGTVWIRARIDEVNLRDWRVQVDGQDIAGNTGTTLDSNREFAVAWNASGFPTDGSHTITFRVRDRANNENLRSVNVTLDRVAPNVTLTSPKTGTTFAPGTTITVVVDIADGNLLSVNASGVDVVVRRSDGTFITRVARISFRIMSDGSLRWIGRISWRDGFLPPTFQVVASVMDKAGNRSTDQKVTCYIGA